MPPPSLPATARRERTTLLALLAGNLATLVLALANGWSLGALVLPYWLQSVAIGVFNIRRMLALRRFSTEGFSSGGGPVPETRAGQVSTATFFAVHYGLFHLFYLLFLVLALPAPGEWPGVLACGVVLWLSQWQAHRAERAADAQGRPNLGLMMFAPYVRILPMHLVLIFGVSMGGGGSFALLFFGVLKTAADLAAHAIEQHLVARSAAGTAR
jgi:4-hydroxybenzoate polyprenyltransferase